MNKELRLPTHVRALKESDAFDVTKIVKRFLHDNRAGTTNRFSAIDYDAVKMYSYTKRVANDPMFFTRVAERDGKLVGIFHAELREYIFSSSLLATDHIIYVVPEISPARSLITFVTEYVAWAKENGAIEATLSSSTGIRQQNFARLAQRFGFDPAIVGFTRRL